MIGIESKDNLKKVRDRLAKISRGDFSKKLDHYGQLGVEALSRGTPIETGLTANSWGYRVKKTRRGAEIEWYNTNDVNGTPVAILIQYGHGTGTGGYVPGRDFINPSMRPIFDEIVSEIRKEMRNG